MTLLIIIGKTMCGTRTIHCQVVPRLCTIHCQLTIHCQVAVYNTLSSCALDIIGCVQYIVKLHKSVAKK